MKPLSPKLRKLMFGLNEREPISKKEEATRQKYNQWRHICHSRNLGDAAFANDRKLREEAEAEKESVWEAIQQKTQKSYRPKFVRGIKAIDRKQAASYAMAAAVLLSLGFAAYKALLLTAQKKPTQQFVVATPENIQPGSAKATLWLENNVTLYITPGLHIGKIAQQAEAIISKIQANSIGYECRHKEPLKAAQITNRLAVPASGEYTITLSDGTRVQLDANSSLKYPAAFSGKDRRVELEGRALFKVAHNPQKPFIVFVHNKNITAYGTVFTVYAYNGDSVAATLVEGAVTIGDGKSTKKLHPGEKAVMQTGSINIQQVNTNNETAWANGSITFKDKPFKYAIEEIGRWYNIDIEFKTDPNNIQILGDFPRTTPFETVYDLLNSEGRDQHVRFELKDRKLIMYKI